MSFAKFLQSFPPPPPPPPQKKKEKKIDNNHMIIYDNENSGASDVCESWRWTDAEMKLISYHKEKKMGLERKILHETCAHNKYQGHKCRADAPG